MTAADHHAHAVASEFADAVLQQVKQTGAATPQVRGADWRQAIVATVGADGTIITRDGITARRMPTYHLPVVGDQVVITQSSTGNWLCCGRPTSTADSGGWVPLPLAPGFGWPGHGTSPAYLREDRRITLRGRIDKAGATVPNNTTVATLPAAIRPGGGGEFGWAGVRDSTITPALVRLAINPSTGQLRIYETGTAPTWISLDGCSYYTE
ncbi:hypothetical protein [Streptomyces sp. x-80]|uniref:hypothetical protein n=1 Tax=Streptomyces sp. x-80 TaxID=2789282 RepID=UPI00397F7A53